MQRRIFATVMVGLVGHAGCGGSPGEDAATTQVEATAGSDTETTPGSTTPMTDADGTTAIDPSADDDDPSADDVDDTGDDTTGGPLVTSAGCGITAEAFAHLQPLVANTTYRGTTSTGRAYEVDLHPAVLGANANAIAVPLLFGIHGCYETIENSRNNLFRFLALAGDDPSRPFIGVYPKSAGDCWEYAPSSSDHAYLQEVYAQVFEDLCFDTGAIFFAGQSSGGYQANAMPMWPIFGGLPGSVAGIAVNAGGLPFGAPLPSPARVSPVHVFAIHGTIDPIVPVAQGAAARDYWIDANDCSTSAMPLDPLPTGCMPYDPGDPMPDQFDCECVVYDDCASARPVRWCEHRWDIHYMPDWGPAAILDFFFDVYG